MLLGMLNALLTVVLPVMVVLLIGAVAGRGLKLEVGPISRLSLYVLTPALALNSLLTTQVSGGEIATLAGAYVLLSLLGVLLGWLGSVGLPPQSRRAMMACVAIGNNGNYGLPVALFALSKAGFEQAIVIFLASVILTYTVGTLIYGASRNIGATLGGMARMPVLWCVLLAVIMRALHLELPLGVARGLELLSGATLPMVLLSLGIQLGTGGRPKLSAPVWIASGLRVVGMPLLALVVARLLGLHGLSLRGLVLSATMPTAVNAFILAREYRSDHEMVASTVLVTTLLSIPALSVVVPLLPHLP